MKGQKKVYSTPEGLKFSASGSLSNASFVLILNLIWQYAMAFLKPTGGLSVFLTLIGFGLLLAAAILVYNAMDTEIQADAIENETPDKHLVIFKKLVIACIAIRAILSVLAVVFAFLFQSVKNSLLYEQIDAIINIIGNIFTSSNILGLFTYRLFIQEGDDKKLRTYTLISLLLFLARFLLIEIRYILQLTSRTVNFISLFATIISILSYFAFYLSFDARKNIFKKKLKEVEN